MAIKNHAVYGDDDQAKLQALFDQQDDIQRVVDASNRLLKKERLKNIKKKKQIDTTANAVNVKEVPEDIKEGKPEKPKKEKKNKKEKKTSEPKQLNSSGIKKVGIIFILLILALLVFQFRTEVASIIKTGYSQALNLIGKGEKLSVDDNSDNENTLIINENGGYLNEEDLSTTKAVLAAANNANAALHNYYESLVEIASKSKTEDVVDEISKKASMIDQDMKVLTTYEADFSSFPNGGTYYQSLKNRFEHLQNLITNLTFVDQTKIYSYINQAINEENEYIIQGKNELVNFLKANNIQYTVNDSSVTYEIN